MRLDSLLTSILPTPLTVSALLLCLASALVLGILTALVFTRGCRHTASFALTLALRRSLFLLPLLFGEAVRVPHGKARHQCAQADEYQRKEPDLPETRFDVR